MGRLSRLRAIKSEKEELTWSNLSQNASTLQSIVISEAVNSPTTAGQVEIGDTINYVFFEVNIAAQETGVAKVVHWCVSKDASGLIGAINPITYDPAFKKFILHRGMEMLPNAVSTVFKRIFVVKIPRVYKRQGESDKIRFNYICSSTEQINNCGFAIFKHFG